MKKWAIFLASKTYLGMFYRIKFNLMMMIIVTDNNGDNTRTQE